MAVHAVLNKDAGEALKALTARLKGHNPSLNKFQNALVSFAVVDLLESLTDSKVKALAEKLLSRAGKKKVLETRMANLMQNLDENTFQSMEAGLRKILNQFEKESGPTSNPAEGHKKRIDKKIPSP